jgi:predicted ribosome quality control (RQC) complex YloA/Tae2 family protein
VLAGLEYEEMAKERPGHGPEAPEAFTYTLPGGWIVYAGKTDVANDQLSLKVARPNDWWFHVRGMPGSHVLLRVDTGATPPRDTLKQAAAIAAYHSKARTGGLVAVSGTPARYVTKPRGVKPGTVTIRRETVFQVRPALPVPEATTTSS